MLKKPSCWLPHPACVEKNSEKTHMLPSLCHWDGIVVLFVIWWIKCSHPNESIHENDDTGKRTNPTLVTFLLDKMLVFASEKSHLFSSATWGLANFHFTFAWHHLARDRPSCLSFMMQISPSPCLDWPSGKIDIALELAMLRFSAQSSANYS